MSYIYFNPNPLGKRVGDCVIRAVGKLTEQDWETVYRDERRANAELRTRRGRSPSTGRYVSRDSHDSGSSGGSHYGDGGSSEQSRDGGASTRRYYDGSSSRGSYSGHSIQDRMIDRLERMIDEAQNEHERETVAQWIKRLKD